MSLDGFSMHPLAKELHAALSGGRIDKITQPNRQSILLSIRQPGRNYLLHISINPQNPVMHLTTKNFENPPEPPLFCMVLRKQIETGRIAEIRQNGLDRLLVIDIDFLAAGGKIITKSLIIELMGKYSNIILVQDDIIVDSLRKVGAANSRVRLVLPGHPYELPPGQDKLNLLTVPLDSILAEIRQRTDLKLSKALLDVCLGFGPVSARETAFLAGLAANMLVSSLDDADFASLQQALTELIEGCTATAPSPCLILDEHKKILAMASFPLHYLPDADRQEFQSISEMLSLAAQLTGSYIPPDKERFRKLVHNELNRAENKAGVLRDELTNAQNAEDYRILADNLMTYQYALKDHADAQAVVTNIYSEQGEKIVIALDQRLSISQNVQAYYHKYDKLKRAQKLLQIQIDECHQDIQYLSSIAASLDASATLAEINEIRNELIAGGYLREKPKKKIQDKPSKPFRFQTPDGTTILVGKNNYQNDSLTFKTAHFNDLWFHTKDIPGSHVILLCENELPSEENILLAASLAAHFSQAAASSKIPVDYTQVRYVKKPSGARPGFVIFTNQNTLYITPAMEQLKPLLEHDLNA